MAYRMACLPIALSLALLASAQNLPSSDPTTTAILTRSQAALTGGVAIYDVTLSGQAATNGDRDTGLVTLLAKGAGESRVSFSDTKPRTEIQGLTDGEPTCHWFGEDRITHDGASHNCLTDAAWFFPALSRLAEGASASQFFKDLGEVTESGLTLRKIQSWRTTTHGTKAVLTDFSRLSRVDFYLDQKSLLPVVLRFNVHPDDDASTDIPVEVRFSDYRNVNGVNVPFRIQRFMSGNLALDIIISEVTLNTGLRDASFAAN